MKLCQHTLPRLAFLIAMAALHGPLVGQTTPAPAPAPAAGQPEGETIVLSPFEVTASAEEGYAAASTLAGNRLNTNLKDVGSAITVITAQMLRDIGATSNESLLQYATNSEVGNIYGNMANAGSGNQLDETSRFVAPNMNTRIRGLAAGDNTMDYFLTDIPWDSYNVDRVDMQRGPNAILFGLGSPAGIINAGTKQAGYRNRGSLELRYSRFGSIRTALDLNQVLLPQELSVRLNLLRNDEKFQQEPAYQLDERLAAALRYEPRFLNRGSARTTLKASYEKGAIESNRPRAVPPSDLLSPWFETGTVAGYDTVTGVPRNYNNMNKMGFNAIGLNSQAVSNTLTPGRGEFNKFVTINGVTSLNPYWQPYLGGQFAAGYFGGPMATFEGGDSPVGRLNVWEPTTIRGINAAGVIDGNVNGFPGNLRMLSLTTYRDWANKIGLPGAGSYGLARAVHVTDPSVFDFYNQLIDGPNKQEWQNFDRYNVNLTQTFFDGNIGIEGVYDRQSFDNGQLVFMTDKGQALYIDVMQILADGSTNPNFGRPFIADGPGNNRVTFIEREAKRATVFVKHEFDKGDRDSFLARLLGRQQLTGFVNSESRTSDSRRFIRYGSNLAFKEALYGVNGPTAPFAPVNINFDDARRVVYPVVYLGPSLKDRASAAGSYIPAPSATHVAQSGSIRVFDSTWNPPAGVNPGDVWNNPLFPEGNPNRVSTQSENPANYRGWVNIPFNVIDSEQGNRDRLTASADLTRSTLSSDALVWNGYFWDGGLVGLYGWREDVSKAWSHSAARTAETPGGALTGPVNLDRSVYKLPAAYRDIIKEQSRSWSVVAHLGQLFPRLPLPVEVSLFYNESQNFAASAGRVGVYNENLGPPKGDTQDMGIRIATKDGKYALKVNKYESNVKNASSSGANLFYLSGLITGYTQHKNVFKYQIDTNGSFDLSGPTGTNPARWQWLPTGGMDAAQTAALQASSIAAWEAMLAEIPDEFYAAYRIPIDQVTTLTSVSPPGLTMTEDNVSKGYEAELYASPVQNLRLSLNVSNAKAMRDNVGQESIVTVVNIINKALNTTDAGKMRDGPSATAVPALNAWNANFMAQFNGLKQQEGGKVPELREWRANLIANYDFSEGRLKGFNVGVGLRWQSKVIIGYEPQFLNPDGTPATNHITARVAVLQLDRPFYGPAETNIDLWIGYKRKLTDRINLRTQLNVRNVGEGNSLIPVTVQPDGTPAGYRIAPTQVWSLTSTFEF